LSTEFVVDLVKQGFLILNSVIGGIAAANAYLEYRKQIFDNRISFLNDCDINFPKTEQTN
jgi:hypothetical protein